MYKELINLQFNVNIFFIKNNRQSIENFLNCNSICDFFYFINIFLVKIVKMLTKYT